MTAEEAHKLALDARAPKSAERDKVALVVRSWEEAIAKAAANGYFTVYQSELTVYRTPIPVAAQAEGRAQLATRGFLFNFIESRGEYQCSWQ